MVSKMMSQTVLSSRSLSYLSVVLCLLLAGSAQVFADSSGERGRLADGRAFRVDAQGLQITDQLAELEVTVDDLRRQVVSLENEIVLKEGALRRCSSGNCDCDVSSQGVRVLESDLDSEDKKPQGANASSSANSGALSRKLAANASQCQRYIVPLNQRLNRLQALLDASSASNRSLRHQGKQEQGQAVKDLLAVEVGKVEELHEAEMARLENEQEHLTKEYGTRLSEMKQQTQGLQQELSQTNEQFGQLQIENQELSVKNVELEKLLKKSRQELAKSAEQLKLAKAAASKATQARSRLQNQIVKQPVHENVTGELAIIKRKFAEIDGLVNTRASLLKRVRASGKGVTINSQALRSRAGLSLEAYKSMAKDITTKQQAMSIIEGSTDISRVIEQDVVVLKRLLNIR